jgi:hypothetical protein
MSAIGGTKGWLVVGAVAALVAFAMVPAFAGTASASPAPASTDVPANQWAYGGMGYSNSTVVIGTSTLSWNATFGWTVVFTSTSTGPNTTMVEEQRTVGINVIATYSAPSFSAKYTYHGQEADVAFANLTNASTVYENGVAVPAVGLMNDASSITGSIAETLAVTHAGVTRNATFDLSGSAHLQEEFAPALGLIPLNLSGAHQWNSTATIMPSGSWNVNWSWANNGFGNNTGSGSGSANGTAGVSGTVHLMGYLAQQPAPIFPDHKPRVAIVLVVEGPLGNYWLYDGYVIAPGTFPLFGTGTPAYDADAYGSASIQAQTFDVSSTASGPQITAGATTFGAATPATGGLVGSPTEITSSAAPSSPGTTVQGNPMTVPAAQAEANCLTVGCGGAAASNSGLGFGLVVVVAALAVVAAVGSVAVIEWRSYARRKARKGLVGGYAESWSNGVPPSVASPVPPSAANSTPSGPSAPEMPPRQN